MSNNYSFPPWASNFGNQQSQSNTQQPQPQQIHSQQGFTFRTREPQKQQQTTPFFPQQSAEFIPFQQQQQIQQIQQQMQQIQQQQQQRVQQQSFPGLQQQPMSFGQQQQTIPFGPQQQTTSFGPLQQQPRQITPFGQQQQQTLQQTPFGPQMRGEASVMQSPPQPFRAAENQGFAPRSSSSFINLFENFNSQENDERKSSLHKELETEKTAAKREIRRLTKQCQEKDEQKSSLQKELETEKTAAKQEIQKHKQMCKDAEEQVEKLKTTFAPFEPMMRLSSCSVDELQSLHEALVDAQSKVMKEMKKRTEAQLCSVCMDNRVNVALLPCGHVFCNVCITRSDSNLCLLCRKLFTQQCKIFM